MFKKLFPVFGAVLLLGIAYLCQALDLAHAATPTPATCTAGIRGAVDPAVDA